MTYSDRGVEMRRGFWLIAIFLTMLIAVPVRVPAREKLFLSGAWEFRTDPTEVGEKENWFATGARFDRTITVPGAWNAQGVGDQTKALYSGYSGAAWYRKHFDIPQSWRGKRVRLWFDGVHRTADVWVNGESMGSHIGYVTPFVFDITPVVVKDWRADIVVRVDSRRRPATDPLYGCMDLMDLGGVEWGGIHKDVWIEPVDTSWIENVFVSPRVGSGVAEVVVDTGSQILYGSPEPQPEFHIQADVFDMVGKHVGSGTAQLLPAMGPVYAMVAIDNPKLWTPKRPYLYTVDVRLVNEGKELDVVSERFGMRELEADGSRFLLNGRPIFLRGFGDDCVFANTIAPPTDKKVYLTRLKAARDYGFNYIRCHSWIPPKEYLDAADEIGIMVQPELPIAYAQFYNAGTPELQQFYMDQWQDVIKANRNHPSVVTWSMSNEMWGGFDLAQSMYLAAKELDPTGLVIDSDGLFPPNAGEKPRATLDFYACQFDEQQSMGFGDRKYDLGQWKPVKPVVIHEMGNFGTFPDLAQEKLFAGGVRPFWLSDARALAETKGVTSRLAKWKANSDRLQAAALKTNMEDARRSPGISGYDQWLLQDYWTGSNGVLDMFFASKGLSASQFRQFNAPTVLLMDCPRRTYRLGETANVTLLVSRYEDAASANAKLTWKLTDTGKAIKQARKTGLKIRADGVQTLMSLALKMPASGAARKLTLSVQLDDANGTVSNAWDFWVVPASSTALSGSVCVAGCDQVKRLYPKARSVDPDSSPVECDLLIASELTKSIIDYLVGGGRVLLLGAEGSLPTVASSYKPYWWLGNAASDSNAGTVVDPAHPALSGLPKQDWCDLEWYHLLEGSNPVLVDNRCEPIIRCIDLPSTMRDKAYLFEAGVGKGRLLVAAMNFGKALEQGDPFAGFLLDGLIRYELTAKSKPTCDVPPESLTDWRTE